MRVYQLGRGDPEVAVVGAIHGDEPCGARAVERLVRDDPAVERPAKLIVANEAALERGVRFVDADLNRAFAGPADPDGPDARGEDPVRERGLARRLADEIRGCTVLSIHSTQSYDEPFAIAAGRENRAAAIAPHLSVVALVTLDADEGRLFAVEAALLEVEAGRQGTERAAENAYRLAREFLTATGVLPGRTVARNVPVYRLRGPIEKPPASTYEVFAENFERVAAGEAFAAADGEPLHATDAFYPVLLSAHGYPDIFGYEAEYAGELGAPPDDRLPAGERLPGGG